MNMFTVHWKVLTKCQVCLPCHINCTKSLGQSATCPHSSQLSQDQGSHPLITPPSQNKKAGYGPQSHQDKRKLVHGGIVSRIEFFENGSNAKWSVPYHQLKTGHNSRFKRYDQIVFRHFFSLHILFLAFIFESGDQCDKRCVVTTTKLGLGNSRHTQPPSSGCLPPQPINCGQSETGEKKVWNTSEVGFHWNWRDTTKE